MRRTSSAAVAARPGRGFSPRPPAASRARSVSYRLDRGEHRRHRTFNIREMRAVARSAKISLTTRARRVSIEASDSSSPWEGSTCTVWGLVMARPAAQRPSPSCCSQGGGSFGAALAQGQPPGELTLELVAQAGVGDGGPALEAPIGEITGLAVDADGRVYLASRDQKRIRRISADGTIQTVAGVGAAGGPDRSEAGIRSPVSVAIGPDATVYLADQSTHRIWALRKGVARVFAGTGRLGSAGDGGPATEAQLAMPSGVAVSPPDGVVYICDKANNRIRAVGPDRRLATFVSGNLESPEQIAASSSGAVYVVDRQGRRLGRARADGSYEQLKVPWQLTVVTGIATAADVLYASGGGEIWRFTQPTGWTRIEIDRSAAAASGFRAPAAIAVHASGAIFTVDIDCDTVWRIDESGRPAHFAGRRGAPPIAGSGVAAAQGFSSCGGLAANGAGVLFVSDPANSRVVAIGSDGTLRAVAGRGERGSDGDGGPAARAALDLPLGIDADEAGRLCIADPRAHRIRCVEPDGTIRTVAGTGTGGFSGDGGPAAAASLSRPSDVAVDRNGSVYIADRGNRRVRRVGPDGIISTLAGTGDEGMPADGAPAAQSPIGSPESLVAHDGRLLVAVPGNHAVYEIDGDGKIRVLLADATREGTRRPWTPLDVAVAGQERVVVSLLTPWFIRHPRGLPQPSFADTPRHAIRAASPSASIGSLSSVTAAPGGELFFCERDLPRIWRTRGAR